MVQFPVHKKLNEINSNCENFETIIFSHSQKQIFFLIHLLYLNQEFCMFVIK